MPPDLLSVAKWLAKLVADELKHSAPTATDGADGWLAIRQCPEPRAVRRAITAGALRAFRVGRALLVKRSDLDQWIESHPHQPRAPSTSVTSDPIERMVASGRLRRISGGRS